MPVCAPVCASVYQCVGAVSRQIAPSSSLTVIPRELPPCSRFWESLFDRSLRNLVRPQMTHPHVEIHVQDFIPSCLEIPLPRLGCGFAGYQIGTVGDLACPPMTRHTCRLSGVGLILVRVPNLTRYILHPPTYLETLFVQFHTRYSVLGQMFTCKCKCK